MSLKAKRNPSNGFTLVEALLAALLVGIAVIALVASSGSLTMVSGAGAELSTAEFLIEQIRELTDLLVTVDPQTGTFGCEEASLADYDDVDDFDNGSFNPPITADRQSLDEFVAYTQQVTVQNVSASDFQQVVADGSTDFVKVSVTVLLNGREISSSSWIRADH